MRKLELSKANAPLAEYVQEICKEPIVLTVGGEPAFALIPVKGVDMESLALSTDAGFLAMLQKSRDEYDQKGGHTLEEVIRELEEEDRKRAERGEKEREEPDESVYLTFSTVLKKVTLNKATEPLTKYINRARKEPLIVTKRDPIAALVTVDEEDMATLTAPGDLDFWAIIERARNRGNQPPANPSSIDQAERELEIAKS